MDWWKHFECCKCHEPFTYDPSPMAKQRLEEMQFITGRPFVVMVECPHCPACLCLDLINGSANDIIKQNVDSSEMGGLFWDMTLTEKIKEEVTQLNKEGNDLMGKGQFSIAREKFQKAIDLRKHDPLSWYNFGLSRLYEGDVQDAKDAFRHALRYDSKFVNAWNNLGTLLLSEGQIEEASDCFDNCINADAGYPKCYLGKGNVCLLRGNVAEAKRFFEIALEKDPNYDKAKQALKHLESY